MALESIAPANSVRKMRRMAPAVKMRERRAKMGPVQLFRIESSERCGWRGSTYGQP